jgi:hypothetical protein
MPAAREPEAEGMRPLPARPIAVALLSALLVLVVVAAVSLLGHVPMPMMTRDIAALGHLHPLAGVLSNLGILLWTATAAICLFVARTERDRLSAPVARYFLCAGLLTLWLALDDGFQIHEELSPQYLHIRERYVYLALAVATVAHLWSARAVILRSNWSLLALAFGFLAGSALLDTLLAGWFKQIGEWEFFYEDGAKWLGIVCWSAYHVLACSRRAVLDRAVREGAPIRHLAWLVPSGKLRT